MRSQLGPGVGRGHNLREGPECETPGTLDHDDARPPAGCLQCQPVLGQRGCRPQLLASFDGQAAPVPKDEQPLPVAAIIQAVDLSDQLVEVAQLDQFVKRHQNPDRSSSSIAS
jgi:hypothetical protein